MAKKITFSTEKRMVKDLIPCDYNPRTLSEKQRKDLRESLERFDYVEICVINTDNKIMAGHQRISVMKDLGWDNREVEVRVPNRKLTKKEYDEYLLRSNRNGGEYDLDILFDNFDIDFLQESGFEKELLKGGADYGESIIKDSGYEPDVNPKIENKTMTEKEMEKTRAEMNTHIAETKKTVSVICPSCGEEFGIDG
jgi:hypothetical protein